jgi:hypothetical protein
VTGTLPGLVGAFAKSREKKATSISRHVCQSVHVSGCKTVAPSKEINIYLLDNRLFFKNLPTKFKILLI